MDNFRDSPLQLNRGYNMQSIGISSSVMYSNTPKMIVIVIRAFI